MSAPIECQGLHVCYPGAGGAWAVEDVTLALREGECLGLVGGSGSGKSTLALALMALLPYARGVCHFQGVPYHAFKAHHQSLFRRAIQIVFQDPLASLNPRMTIAQTLSEALTVHRLARGRAACRARVVELMRMVRLDPALADRYPHEFSGGQRQRIGIARALAVEPRILVADEPVSALDVSVQAQILNLFSELRERLGLTLLLVAHDLAVVRHMADRVAVLRQGRLMECAATADLFDHPETDYTRALIAAVPVLPA